MTENRTRRLRELRQFAGFLSAEIEELHHVEMYRLADAVEKFAAVLDTEGTDRPITDEHSTCPDCGGGWTFDFLSKRVYCRQCEERHVPKKA